MDEQIKCPDCGRVWELTRHKTIDRDSDTFDCKCGKELKRWNGAHFYLGELVEDPNANDRDG